MFRLWYSLALFVTFWSVGSVAAESAALLQSPHYPALYRLLTFGHSRRPDSHQHLAHLMEVRSEVVRRMITDLEAHETLVTNHLLKGRPTREIARRLGISRLEVEATLDLLRMPAFPSMTQLLETPQVLEVANSLAEKFEVTSPVVVAKALVSGESMDNIRLAHILYELTQKDVNTWAAVREWLRRHQVPISIRTVQLRERTLFSDLFGDVSVADEAEPQVARIRELVHGEDVRRALQRELNLDKGTLGLLNFASLDGVPEYRRLKRQLNKSALPQAIAYYLKLRQLLMDTPDLTTIAIQEEVPRHQLAWLHAVIHRRDGRYLSGRFRRASFEGRRQLIEQWLLPPAQREGPVPSSVLLVKLDKLVPAKIAEEITHETRDFSLPLLDTRIDELAAKHQVDPMIIRYAHKREVNKRRDIARKSREPKARLRQYDAEAAKFTPADAFIRLSLLPEQAERRAAAALVDPVDTDSSE